MRPQLTLALLFVAVLAGCGSTPPSPESVVRAWSQELNTGDNEDAAKGRRCVWTPRPKRLPGTLPSPARAGSSRSRRTATPPAQPSSWATGRSASATGRDSARPQSFAYGKGRSCSGTRPARRPRRSAPPCSWRGPQRRTNRVSGRAGKATTASQAASQATPQRPSGVGTEGRSVERTGLAAALFS
jgi:hypothetical protein